MNETMKALLERRSTRHYTAEPVSPEDLEQILEAGLWAPTARNAQEIKIAVMTNPAERKAFREAFAAKDGRPRFANFDYGCPVFLFLYGDRDFPYTEMDSGIVVENMAIAAESLGLGTVIIGCIRDFMRSDAAAAWRARIGMTDGDLFTIGLCIGHIEKPTEKQARKEGRILYL
jgi:nitroreductase